MRITINKIHTVSGDTYYKVTDYERSGVEVIATSLPELLHTVIEHAGFAVDIEDCHMLANKATS